MSTIFTSRQLFESVLDKLRPNSERQEIENLLSCFYYMFRDELVESLNLVEKECITLVYANKRQIYEIVNNNKVYHCFKHTYYCTCLSFTHNVIKSNEIILCKHIIASSIIERIGKLKYKKVDDDYLIKVFRGFDDL